LAVRQGRNQTRIGQNDQPKSVWRGKGVTESRNTSRKGAKAARCHFERREKSFLDPSHMLGMTDSGPVTWRSWRLGASKSRVFKALNCELSDAKFFAALLSMPKIVLYLLSEPAFRRRAKAIKLHTAP